MEAQVSGDVLDVVCINGGPITQVEQEEMPSLLADARACTYRTSYSDLPPCSVSGCVRQGMTRESLESSCATTSPP